MTVTGLPVWLQPLAEALRSPDRLQRVVGLRPGRGGRAAAVLVLVGQGPAGLEVVLVERSATLRTHASQIAFPGGAADPGDVDLVATALREAEEEVGVRPADVQVLGLLPPVHVAVSGFDVTAVVGWWRDPGSLPAPDPREVAAVHVVPVAALTDPAHRGSVRHPSGYTGPAFQVGDHLVWGLTGHLLDGVLQIAAWSRPWDTDRLVEIPDRYLTAPAARLRHAADAPAPGHPDLADPDPGGLDAH